MAAETARQAKDLIGEAHTQLKDQASAQKDKATGGLHSLADGLRSMADGNGAQAGVAADLAKEAADKAKAIATWLEQRDPGTILNDVRDLARRRPGAFLLGAALAGVAAGRLTRGVMAAGPVTSGATTTGTAGTAPSSNGFPSSSDWMPDRPLVTPLAPLNRPTPESFPRQDTYRGTDTGFADAPSYRDGASDTSTDWDGVR